MREAHLPDLVLDRTYPYLLSREHLTEAHLPVIEADTATSSHDDGLVNHSCWASANAVTRTSEVSWCNAHLFRCTIAKDRPDNWPNESESY